MSSSSFTNEAPVTRTILIVDDEPHLRTLIHQTLEELEDEGVELLTASNGDEALAQIRTWVSVNLGLGVFVVLVTLMRWTA